MAINASIITDTAKEATKRTVVDYGAGVFAHTTQDWAKHNVARIYATPFISSGVNVALNSLRLVATRDDASVLGQDLVLLIPINPNGTTVITSSAPIIIQQPANKTVPPLTNVQIQVAAISDLPVTFQWQKLIAAVWTSITGARATNLVLTGVSAASDNGSYRVIVTNDNGSVTSGTAVLSVVAGASGSQGDPWFESLPPFKIFSSIF